MTITSTSGPSHNPISNLSAWVKQYRVLRCDPNIKCALCSIRNAKMASSFRRTRGDYFRSVSESTVWQLNSHVRHRPGSLLEQASGPFGAPTLLPEGGLEFLPLSPIAGNRAMGTREGAGHNLPRRAALAHETQGRSLYCLRPLRPSLQDASGQGLVGCPRRCLQRQNSSPPSSPLPNGPGLERKQWARPSPLHPLSGVICPRFDGARLVSIW